MDGVNLANQRLTAGLSQEELMYAARRITNSSYPSLSTIQKAEATPGEIPWQLELVVGLALGTVKVSPVKPRKPRKKRKPRWRPTVADKYRQWVEEEYGDINTALAMLKQLDTIPY